jgi:glutamate 5-kinase
MLTDVDGLLDEDGSVISCVEDLDSRIISLGRRSRCDLGTGGMATKLEAAKTVTSSGIGCVIANGRKKGIILKVIDGEDVGTAFRCGGARLIAKKRWIAFSSRPKGTIAVDRGAAEALLKKNKSLLASGITDASGNFRKGDVVRIVDDESHEIARGVSNYSAADISKIKGLRTDNFKAVLGRECRDEVVHKDALVIL